MEFRISQLLPHPLDAVYSTYRDRLPELALDLPNVDGVDVLERHQLPEGMRLVNRWRVSAAVPRAARPFFKADRLSYLDHAAWTDREFRVDWRFEVGLFPEAVDCQGTHYFSAREDGGTEVLFTGDVRIDMARVRGVPRFLHRLHNKVEGYLLRQLQPNLLAIGDAVRRLLDREARAQL